MSTQFADADARDAPRPAPLAVAPNSVRALAALARREFWEHRSLWIVPLVVAALLVFAAIPTHINVNDISAVGPAASAGHHQALFMLVQWVLALPFYLVMIFAVPLYLLDCLYAERRDRSILFWKSLPVSDGLTIASKILVALVLVPFAVYLLALLTHLVFTGIWQVRVLIGTAPGGLLIWDSYAWARMQIAMLLALAVAILWYAPIGAALLLISAWARRVPFMWALLPPLLAPLLERIAFGTTYLWHFLAYRTFGIWNDVAAGAALWGRHNHGDSPLELLDHLSFGAAFANIDLWLGLVVAAALVFAAMRVRRYRDDT